MARVDRIAKRASQKAQLKRLKQILRATENAKADEFKRGFELGGAAMRKAIQQASQELKPTEDEQT